MSPGEAPPSITILLPAKDEEEAIADVIRDLPLQELARRGHPVEVLVVDGRSTDATREIARRLGARVLLQPGRGKGRAVRAALAAATGDVVVMLDADRTYPAEAIPALVEHVMTGADVVMGSRLRGRMEPGAMSTFNHFGNRALSGVASLLYGGRVTDVCTGMWALRRKAVLELPLTSTHFEIEAELYAESRKAGLSIVEVPIPYRRRLGETKLGKLRDGFAIGRTLIERRVLSRGAPQGGGGGGGRTPTRA